MLKRLFSNLGPGPLIAAAFIGPGTITLCTLAGINYGMDLLWALLIAILAAMILQTMSIKIGLIGQKNITEALKSELDTPWIKQIVIALIFLAILIGNTAYEAGNISGAVLGLEALFGTYFFDFFGFIINPYSLFIGTIAVVLLGTGKHKLIERFMIGLVIIMSISFLFTAIVTKPSLQGLFAGLFTFNIPEGSFLMIIGLVGTTIVPYNLFLHTALVKEKWKNAHFLPFAIKDLIIALGLGGLISMSVIITSAGVEIDELSSVADLAIGLEPIFGTLAKYFMALGLFAAGITSTITAPLAAAYVVCGCFGWSTNLDSKHFKVIWFLIIAFGVVISATSIKLISIIKFAQVINGVVLPLIAGLLLWMVNKRSLLGNLKNNTLQNALGGLVVLIALFLSIRTLFLVFYS
jgi:NRAMP (natural resistance-associated macrophage protein)-like metal ion transporter